MGTWRVCLCLIDSPAPHHQVMTTEVLRSMLYRGSEIVREAALVVRAARQSDGWTHNACGET
jgi:hypothetical protein